MSIQSPHSMNDGVKKVTNIAKIIDYFYEDKVKADVSTKAWNVF